MKIIMFNYLILQIMAKKFLEGAIASQPVAVTLGVKGIIVYVLIKTSEGYKKFYHFEKVREGALGVYRPSERFSDVIVSSVGDKVRVGFSQLDYWTVEICSFENLDRCLGASV